MGIEVQIEKSMGYIVNYGEFKFKNKFCRPNKTL